MFGSDNSENVTSFKSRKTFKSQQHSSELELALARDLVKGDEQTKCRLYNIWHLPGTTGLLNHSHTTSPMDVTIHVHFPDWKSTLLHMVASQPQQNPCEIKFCNTLEGEEQQLRTDKNPLIQVRGGTVPGSGAACAAQNSYWLCMNLFQWYIIT